MAFLLSKKRINTIRTGFNMVLKPNIVPKLPSQINIEITNACNMNCIACTRNSLINEDSIQSVSLEAFKETINQINPNYLSIAGLGEPTLHPDLIRMISWLNSKKIVSSITTNGISLEKYAEDFVDSGLNLITLSIDSPDQNTYKKIRGQDALPKIEQGLAKLKYFKSKKNSIFPEVAFHMVILKHNYKQLLDILDLAYKYNVCMVYFLPLEVSFDENMKDLISGVERDEFLYLLGQAETKSRRLNIGTNIHVWNRDKVEIFQKYLSPQDHSHPISARPCVRPWVSAYIDVNQNVYPCCILACVGNNDMIIGNLKDESFKEIWNGKKIQKCRKEIKSGRKRIKGCDLCIPFTIRDKFYFFRRKGLFR